MEDIKPHLDPAARRGQPHSQFWYNLATTDPEALRVLEDIVIAEHSKPITFFEGEETHVETVPPHPLIATAKGGVSSTQCVRVSVSSQFCPLIDVISFQHTYQYLSILLVR